MVIIDGSLLIFGIIPLMDVLNGSVATLGTPVPSGTDVICNKARFMLLTAPIDVFIVHLMILCMNPFVCYSDGSMIKIPLALFQFAPKSIELTWNKISATVDITFLVDLFF